MSDKTKGIITGVGIYFAMGILLIITSLLAVFVTEGSWDSLSIVVIMVGIMILVLIGLLLFSIIRYKKTQSQFLLGMIYGLVAVGSYIILSELIIMFIG